MTILRSFMISAGARDGTFRADVVRFHGLVDAHQFGVAILTECRDGGQRPLSSLVGPQGQVLPPTPKATEPTWFFHVTLEWEAMPEAMPDGQLPWVSVGGLFLPSGSSIFVSVRKEV